jgi:YkoY family integral membrane protein
MIASILKQMTPENFMAIAYLVLLEGILSVDNALALAALVKGRLQSEEDQKKALHYGIVGAYLFRIVVIFAGVWLMQHRWVKWIAAAYLIYLGVKELFFKADCEDGNCDSVNVNWLSPLWSTVIAVELMDIMFSIDSIAVALSVSNLAWVLISGAVLGILAMRFAAQTFIKLIERFPILEKTAFVLVIMAGFKIMLELLGIEISEMAFMSLMFAVIGISLMFSDRYVEWRDRDNVREIVLRNPSLTTTHGICPVCAKEVECYVKRVPAEPMGWHEMLYCVVCGELMGNRS